MASILRVLTPGENMYPCSLSIGGGIGLFHGHLIRSITCGQLPVVSFMSLNMFLSHHLITLNWVWHCSI